MLLDVFMDIMIVICGYSENFSVYGYYHENNATVEIWVMNEYAVQSSWTKTFILPIDFIPSEFFFPLCSTKSRDIIGSDDACGFVRYDDKGQWLEYLFDSDERGGYEMAVYTESLLSLPE
jgi:hypothetical protein